MLSVFLWNSTQQKEQRAGPELLEGRSGDNIPEDQVLWIDLENPDPEEEKRVFETFLPVHPLIGEDITRLRRLPEEPPHFPKVEEFPSYLFVVVNPLDPELRERFEKERELPDREFHLTTQLSVVLTRQVLITHHYVPLVSIRQLHQSLGRNPAQASRGPDFLFHLVLDAMVDLYAPVLEGITLEMEQLELHVFARPTQHLLGRLLRIKRLIILIRKTLLYQREVLARMSRAEFAVIDEREAAYYRNVYDHLARSTDLIESSREMVSALLQTHLASASFRLSEIMKLLTMISTALLPMTLIASIYGMNFDVLPGKTWKLGFHFSLILMALSGVATFIYFRWKKWI